MSHPWAGEAFFYHIYPLGLCAAPFQNDFTTPPTARLEALYPWLDHLQNLGANALYLGPLFESSSHGYDTLDYFHLDRRLGCDETLMAFSRETHRRGLRLVLDGVFNHVGRDFFAFRDLQARGEASAYRDWFAGVDFTRPSPKGDPFAYEGWAGHYSLVKLNLMNPDVRAHLFAAVHSWIERFEIDGLRLDAADQIDPRFLSDLSAFCRQLRPDFWLMGEVVFGDYRRLAGPGLLDSATNYEAYKGLWSSLNERNYFEIAYALQRQFGAGGIYADLDLYNFSDNHDVDRVASALKDPAHLYPLYCLLFSMPGIPSIYYGSEWGITGKRTAANDRMLRPAIDLAAGQRPQPDLPWTIKRLANLRRTCPALRSGGYREVHVAAEQYAFLRPHPSGDALVALNSSTQPASLEISVAKPGRLYRDLLNPGEDFQARARKLRLEIPPHWARILTA